MAVTQELTDLLYSHFHAMGQKERNEFAGRITGLLGAGEHKIGDQTIVVDEPKPGDGWTRYNVYERPPK
jgi:hypothetical protein